MRETCLQRNLAILLMRPYSSPGATGFIGTAVVSELIAAGHHVLGLCRSPGQAAAALAAAGAEVHRGSIDDPDSLKTCAARSDGVIHLAFKHDFSKFKDNCEDDRRVIRTLGSVLAGSKAAAHRDLGDGDQVNSSSRTTGRGRRCRYQLRCNSPGRVRRGSGLDGLGRFAVCLLVRLAGSARHAAKQGLVSYAIAIAREKGVYAYVGDGNNRWPAAHLTDVARLYRLALATAEPGARYHAVADEGVSLESHVGDDPAGV